MCSTHKDLHHELMLPSGKPSKQSPHCLLDPFLFFFYSTLSYLLPFYYSRKKKDCHLLLAFICASSFPFYTPCVQPCPPVSLSPLLSFRYNSFRSSCFALARLFLWLSLAIRVPPRDKIQLPFPFLSQILYLALLRA